MPSTLKRFPAPGSVRAAGILLALLPILCAAQATEAEQLIAAGHWKKARTLVDARLRQAPPDALTDFLLSQIHHAFGDDSTPEAFAEKAVALDGGVARYHRQLAETMGIEAQHAGPIQLVFLSRQFRKELDTALALDPRDVQAHRDLLEYYLLAPGIAGGDIRKAAATAEQIAVLDAPEGFLARARIAAARRQTSQQAALLRQAAAAQPPVYRAQAELAAFCLDSDHADPAAAEAAAREMLKLDSGRVEPWAVLAQVYAMRGDWPALDALLAEASRRCPDDLAPYYRAAAVLLSAGREPARAEQFLRTYLTQEPEGNEPSAADARGRLDRAVRAERGGTAALRKAGS